MLDTRRKFLWGMAVAAPFLAVAGQDPSLQFPKKPTPARPDDQEKEDAPPPGVVKSRLEANDKDIKKKVEKLFQLATELKEQVEKTDSSQVLSLALLKKAEEIEKLAKEIKSRSAG
jgi:hypothetical protein